MQDAGVIGIPDLEAGELPRAYIVLKPNMTASAEDISKFIEGSTLLRGGGGGGGGYHRPHQNIGLSLGFLSRIAFTFKYFEGHSYVRIGVRTKVVFLGVEADLIEFRSCVIVKFHCTVKVPFLAL